MLSFAVSTAATSLNWKTTVIFLFTCYFLFPVNFFSDCVQNEWEREMLINSFSMVTPFSNVFPALNILHISTSVDFSYLLCNSFETVTVGYMSHVCTRAAAAVTEAFSFHLKPLVHNVIPCYFRCREVARWSIRSEAVHWHRYFVHFDLLPVLRIDTCLGHTVD